MGKNLKLYTLTFIASLFVILGRFEYEFPIPSQYMGIFMGVFTAAITLIVYNVYMWEIPTSSLIVNALVAGFIVGALFIHTGGDKLEMTRKALAVYSLCVAFEYFRNFHI